MIFFKIKKFLTDNIDSVLAFFAPLLALIFSITITKPVYMINDDFVFRSVVEGRYFGVHSEFIFFINFLYMRFLKFLYFINDNIPWYDLLFAFFIFVSFFVICLVTNKVLKNDFLNKINSFILFIFSFTFFTTFQFTLVAEILAVSAAVLAGYVIISQKVTKKEITLFSIYILFASLVSGLIRAEALPLILLVCLVFSMFFINKYKFSKKNILILFLIGMTFLINNGLKDYNISVHNRELPKFIEYNEKLNFFNEQAAYNRGDMQFKKIIKDISPELKKSNFSENDFKLLTRWYSTGDNIYNGENLFFLYNNISDKISSKYDFNYIIKKFPSMFSSFFFKKEILLLQLFIVLILSMFILKKEYIYKLIAIHFVFICVVTAISIWLKPLPFRVYYPLLVFEYVLMIFSAYDYKIYFSKINNILGLKNLFFVILLITITYFGFFKRAEKNIVLYRDYLAIQNFDFHNYKYVFIEPMMAWCLLSPYDMDYMEMDNKILYNWNVYSKHYDYKMRKLNMERNLYSNLLKENVFLLGLNNETPIKELEQSIREHQHKDTKAIKIDTILADKIYLYKFLPKNQISQDRD